jgi:hypothetical protein
MILGDKPPISEVVMSQTLALIQHEQGAEHGHRYRLALSQR